MSEGLPRAVTYGKNKSNLDDALVSAGRGYFVAPVSGEGVTLDGPATRAAAQIREWWQRWPNARVGIDLRKSKLMVVEIRAADAQRLAQRLALPPTPLIVQWGDTLRYFFRGANWTPPDVVSRSVAGSSLKIYAAGIMVVPS